MIHWDHEMKRLKVRARLRSLEPRVLVAFAAGALEHAVDAALTPKGAKSKYAAVVREALEKAWQHVEGQSAKLGDLADRIEDLLPDEDDSPPVGCADLLDGALLLCQLVKKPKADDAFEAASYAYQAVSDRFVDKKASAGGEAKYAKAELATPECTGEVELQAALLDTLEQTAVAEVSRASALAAFQRPPQ